MLLGIAHVDITPKPGVELSGFAARVQPSVGALDPLFAKALFLAEGDERLLWLHCDLIGFDRQIVQRFRRWAKERIGLSGGQVMLSATHTHSGPGTIYLQEAGAYDAAYVELLHTRLHAAAETAVAAPESVECATAEGTLTLAVDRRGTASAHTDPRVAAVGFRRPDGTFAAVVVNYAMHPVTLGATNRCLSADVSGQAALALSGQLPGHPLVLMTNGACANLNPPAEDVAFGQMTVWGEQIADAIAPLLRQAGAYPAELALQSRIVPLPLDTLDVPEVNRFAAKALQDSKSLAAWGEKYRRVVEHWRTSTIAEIESGRGNGHREAELFAVRLGPVTLLGVNAEVFSEFTDWLRERAPGPVYLVGYANGDIGYLPTRAAYVEGGYEAEVAHLFYGGFRPKAGGLELLAREATDLLQTCSTR